MRIKLVLAYEGTRYHGWQLQKDTMTIQEVVEQALAKICDHKIRVHGSGRTDAGTHALGQVAHFDPPDSKAHIPWQRALNSVLPESVRVVKSCQVDREFHARFSALSKTYSYTLWTEQDFVYPHRRRYVWKTGPLDMEAMTLACRHITGIHDFKSFMNAGTPVANTRRRVFSAGLCEGFHPCELVFMIKADGFLKQMVRNIVGSLVAIGRGKFPPEHMAEILDFRNRSLAPPTAPARGLCLERVEYPPAHQKKKT
ncbi:tRNA pseudouridine(38-40) synthase TruA [Desulfonatronovibrio hydrogenovorans]|uniref:tRNA pseudouridine(38-40) synthase TruA n=1 Tax=Desulfonatronovibrio hydrogenovorans TaxID=53245 RepID=UPI00055517AC|nr:tRNA pseudouridine(38-40) synthase TruA [Desulfonatronovibrio hydrogenovorans]